MRALAVLATSLLTTLVPAQLSCFSTLHAASCGPTLTISWAPLGGGNQQLTMAADGLHPGAVMALAWSIAPQTVTLPGGCIAMAQPIWSTLHTVGQDGTFSWNRSWPHWARGYFYMQMGSVDLLPNGGLSILTTDAMQAGCL